MCVQYKKKIFLLFRLEINYLSEDRNMHLFLAPWTVCVRNGADFKNKLMGVMVYF